MNMQRPQQYLMLLAVLATAALGSQAALAGDYSTRVVASGLERPTGIVAAGPQTLIITQLPTPGIPGSQGGANTVDLVQLGPEPGKTRVSNLTTGEPEPTNLAIDKRQNLYWTCKSAGVILKRSPNGDVGLFLGGLDQPSGIAADAWDHIYFTLIPTPALPGSEGGMNTVNVSDGTLIDVLSMGEPEPTDIAVGRDGAAYWTCKTAGVILQRTPDGTISLLLAGLDHPTGIAVDHQGERLFFTEVPTPGLPGSQGGANAVWALDLSSQQLTLVDAGDPEPSDITVAQNGSVFWTCSSAGVIVEAWMESD